MSRRHLLLRNQLLGVLLVAPVVHLVEFRRRIFETSAQARDAVALLQCFLDDIGRARPCGCDAFEIAALILGCSPTPPATTALDPPQGCKKPSIFAEALVCCVCATCRPRVHEQLKPAVVVGMEAHL